MALAAVVPSLDEVEKAFHPLYEKQDDGSFVLAVDVESHPKVKGLKSAHERQKAENARLKREAKERETPPEDDEEETEPKPPKDKKGGKDPVSEELRQIRAQLDAERKEKLNLERITAERTAEAAVAAALDAAKGNKLFLEDKLLKHVKGVKKDDGTWEAQVMEGKERRLDESGKPMTVDGLVAAFKSDPKYAGAFEGTGGTGSGSRPGSRPGGGSGPVRTLADLSGTAEKSAYIAAHGLEAYQRLVDASMRQ